MKTTIEMAREAGFKEHNGMIYVTTINDDCARALKAFEALVRLDEREVCAYKAGIAVLGADRGLANRVDQAIRARSNT